ncbi:right-handed parallel beta-helix repeat-containing protein [bacterium]|nr:right-handed parallel beta-helix repeat-containing protein [bacterium]
MDAPMRLILPALLLVLAMAEAGAAGAAFHVSPQGRDNWSGKLEKPNHAQTDGPFATLARARDAIRDLKGKGSLPKGGVTVWVADGVYRQTQSLQLTAEDAGTADSPIAYRATAKTRPRLTGGCPIPTDALTPLQDEAVLQRLTSEARSHVLVADLRTLGLTDLGQFPDRYRGAPAVPELFCNDERMTLARWPNTGWTTIAKIIETGTIPRTGGTGSQGGIFEYSGEAPGRWRIADGVWLQGYWCFDWFDETIRIKSLDPQTKRIELAQPTVYGVKQGNPSPRRYRALNVLEELDSPGEYFIDRAAGRLLFCPPAKLAGARLVLSTLNAPIVELKDASYVTFRGFTIEAGLGDGVAISGGTQNALLACEVRNVRQVGVNIGSGTRHRVEACDIHDTGTGGVILAGGDRKTLTPGGHEAVNNHIWRYSIHQLTYANAFLCQGVGHRMAHNLIHDAPHQAIGVHGNDHIFEYNIVHHICTETDDCGAYYKGRNPSCRGNIVRYNFWHNIGSPMGHGNAAVYFDDGDGGDFVIGNIFFRCGDPGRGSFGSVFSHGGFDLLADNNIFLECKRPLGSAPWPYKRYMDFLKDPGYRKLLVQDVDITSETYTKRYPELVGFLDMPETRPRVSKATRNVRAMCAAVSSGSWQVPETDNWITDQDPGFVNAARGDFRLRADAPVFKHLPGFQPIPFAQMGLVKSELRPVLPVEQWTYPPPQQLPPLAATRAAATPAKTTPPPVFVVSRATAPVTVDGVIEPAEWGGAKPEAAMLLAQDVNGSPASRRSRAWLAYSADALVVAITSDINPDTKLEGNQWGTNDAVEVALQAAKGKPIYVLRGYPNGHLQFGRAPNGDEEPLTMESASIVYAAKSPQRGTWVAEFSIPWKMLEAEPTPGARFAFSLSVRKALDDLWLMWEGTRAHSYDVSRAGIIELAE